MWHDEIQPTVVGRAEPHNLRLVHPVEARVVTIRENARCQVSLLSPFAASSCVLPFLCISSVSKASLGKCNRYSTLRWSVFGHNLLQCLLPGAEALPCHLVP